MATIEFDPTPRKLYVRRNGRLEWTELKPTSEAIEVGGLDGSIEPDKERFAARINMTFTVRPMKRCKQIRMAQYLGALKPPRCTYRTIKRGCAKRNR